MKALIVEDDFTSRLLLQNILKKHGEVHIAVNGKEAVEAAQTAMNSGRPYDLICMDIMMPEMDDQAALQAIRRLEETNGVFSSQGAKIIMATALSDLQNVKTAFEGLCDAYLVKPIDRNKLAAQLGELTLIS